jgi:hypothetical protein
MRKNLGLGMGKGYKNLIPHDPFVHSMSARGVKSLPNVVRFGAYQYKITSPNTLGFRSGDSGGFGGISLSPEALLNRMYKQRHNLKAELGRAYQDEASEFELLRIRDELEQLENNIKIVQIKLGKRSLDAKEVPKFKVFVSDEMMGKFARLENEFSPENLTCDGELSNAQVKKKYGMLMREWKALEKEVGHKISRNEVDDWMMERYRQREKAREENKELSAKKVTLNSWTEYDELTAQKYGGLSSEAQILAGRKLTSKARKEIDWYLSKIENDANSEYSNWSEKGRDEIKNLINNIRTRKTSGSIKRNLLKLGKVLYGRV